MARERWCLSVNSWFYQGFSIAMSGCARLGNLLCQYGAWLILEAPVQSWVQDSCLGRVAVALSSYILMTKSTIQLSTDLIWPKHLTKSLRLMVLRKTWPFVLHPAPFHHNVRHEKWYHVPFHDTGWLIDTRTLAIKPGGIDYNKGQSIAFTSTTVLDHVSAFFTIFNGQRHSICTNW